MDDEIRVEDFLTTAKQKAFEHDFFKQADEYEKWEDVDFDAVKEVAGAIAPVPGGVGPVTVSMLLRNTLACAEHQNR